MRKLTNSQKKLLTKAFIEHGCTSVEDLPYEVWKKLEELNNSEVLYTNANIYLTDLKFAEVRYK